jgi:hypothetical protein
MNSYNHLFSTRQIGRSVKLRILNVSISIGIFLPTIFTLILCSPAMAAKVDDFKQAAVIDSGCDSIPFKGFNEDLNKKCKELSEHKNKICNNFSIDRAKVEKTLENYLDSRKKLQDAIDRKNIGAISGLKKQIQEGDEKLSDYKKTAKNLSDKALECLAARENVQRVFSDAKELLKKETDPDLKQYVSTILDTYEKGQREHIKAMQNTTTSMENSKWVSQLVWDRSEIVEK